MSGIFEGVIQYRYATAFRRRRSDDRVAPRGGVINKSVVERAPARESRRCRDARREGICVKHHTPPSSYHVVPRPVSCVPIRSLLPTNSLRVPHDRERRKQLGRDVRIGLVHGEGVARGRCIGRLEGCAEVVLRGEVAGGGGCALEK